MTASFNLVNKKVKIGNCLFLLLIASFRDTQNNLIENS